MQLDAVREKDRGEFKQMFFAKAFFPMNYSPNAMNAQPPT
jgi:hypothetical protein